MTEEGIHANRILQSKVLSKWGGDPRFFVSIKHTMTDYWRHQPWNPSMTEPGPARLVEFQCEREYEFIGMIPNWMVQNGVKAPLNVVSLDAPGLPIHAQMIGQEVGSFRSEVAGPIAMSNIHFGLT